MQCLSNDFTPALALPVPDGVADRRNGAGYCSSPAPQNTLSLGAHASDSHPDSRSRAGPVHAIYARHSAAAESCRQCQRISSTQSLWRLPPLPNDCSLWALLPPKYVATLIGFTSVRGYHGCRCIQCTAPIGLCIQLSGYDRETAAR